MEHHEPSERGRSPGLVTELTFSVLFAVVGVTLVVLCGQPDLDERLDTFLLLILVSILCLGIIGSIYLLYFVKRYRRSLQLLSDNVKSWKIRIAFMCIFVIGMTLGEITSGIMDVECWRVKYEKIDIGHLIFRIANI